MESGLYALGGAVIGALASLAGIRAVLRHQQKSQRQEVKRSTYIEFIDAVDSYHLALLDYFAQAELYFAHDVEPAKESTFTALETLKTTRPTSTAAWRRLKFFADPDIQKIGEQTIRSVIEFPEVNVNDWRDDPDQAKRDLEQIGQAADEVEALLDAFVARSRVSLGYD